MAEDIKKLRGRSLRLIELMDRKRGTQTKLAKSIQKPPGFFSEIKRGKPVNADHLRAVGLVFGPQMVLELLALDKKDATCDQPDRRIEQRRKREQRKDPVHQAPIDLARLRELDKGLFLQTVGEINGRLWAAKEARKDK